MSIDPEDILIAQERKLKYKGSARVPLTSLYPRNAGTTSEKRREKNVERLAEAFISMGCQRLQPENNIPVLIDPRTLGDILQKYGAQMDSVPPPLLELPSGFRLQYLKGQSRVQAAKRVLDPDDQWWVVDLYLDDASALLLKRLSEEVLGPTIPSDGEIYRNIRLNQNNESAKDFWMSTLSPSKRDYLNQFLGHKHLVETLDSLLPVPGLWEDLCISSLHDVIGMRYPEPVISYIHNIRDVWWQILNAGTDITSVADSGTITLLEMRVPGRSEKDAEAIRNGVLLPAVSDTTIRDRIMHNLASIDVLIPSIRTLQEDIKFLAPLTKIVKQIFPKTTSSIQQVMKKCFRGRLINDGEVLIEASNGCLVAHERGFSDPFDLAIFQLWLYAARNFPYMIPECPLKEKRKKAPVPKAPRASAWHAFASLARRLGFQSPQISEILNQDPDRALARNVLLEARAPDAFVYEESLFEQFQDQMTNMFESAIERSKELRQPVFFPDDSDEVPKRRCGRIFSDAFDHDRRYLYPEYLCKTDKGRGQGVGSLFVRFSTLRAFFPSIAQPAAYGSRIREILGNPSNNRPRNTDDDDTDKRQDCNADDKKNFCARIRSLEIENENFRIQQRGNEKLKDEIRNLQAEVDGRNREIESVRAASDLLKKEIGRQSEESSSLKLLGEQRDEKIKELTENLYREREGNSATATERNAQLERDLHTCQSARDESTRVINTMKGDIDRLEEALRIKDHENRQLKEEIAAKTESLDQGCQQIREIIRHDSSTTARSGITPERIEKDSQKGMISVTVDMRERVHELHEAVQELDNGYHLVGNSNPEVTDTNGDGQVDGQETIPDITRRILRLRDHIIQHSEEKQRLERGQRNATKAILRYRARISELEGQFVQSQIQLNQAQSKTAELEARAAHTVPHRIEFRVVEDGKVRNYVTEVMTEDEAIRQARKYIMKNFVMFRCDGTGLSPNKVFDVVRDKTNIVILLPRGESYTIESKKLDTGSWEVDSRIVTCGTPSKSLIVHPGDSEENIIVRRRKRMKRHLENP